jgi:hypothetical protein
MTTVLVVITFASLLLLYVASCKPATPGMWPLVEVRL